MPQSFGFALVMFVAGTHVPVRDRRLRPALRTGLLRAVVVGAVAVGLGYAVAALVGTDHALLYAVLMASSSAAVILPVKESVGLGGAQVLRLLPQVAVADAACIVLLPLAIDPSHALRAGLGALAVVGCGVAAYLAFEWVERSGWRARVHDVSEARSFAIELRVSLAVLFALAALAVALHVSIMLAGFAVGLAVSAVGEPRRVAKQLFAVTEGFFGPVFFVWLGGSLEIRALAGNGAVHQKVASENISKVLYPNDQPEAGKALRLEQQYFLVSCSLQDMIRLHLQRASSLDTFADKFTIQLNDTHPVLAIPELMRLLVDEHNLGWDKAYEITTACMGYTNHTLLPEALETWPLPLFRRLLPRHLEIIYEINHRFLDQVRRRYPGDNERIARMSMIGRTEHEGVRMANIACACSHAVNGVSELHSQLLRQSVLPDFYEMWPEKFSNVTNGVTQRRFMLLANPKLSELITEAIGDKWTSDCGALAGLERFADDPAFVDRFKAVRRANKAQLGSIFENQLGVSVDPDALFDVQIKRIHEYKRQHLNILRVITLYRHLKERRALSEVPRVVILSGKAAPGYYMAKLIIQLIADVASFINLDESVSKQLRVVFVPDLNVKVAQRIYPAADLSEQISLAGKEASGTGNMKFMANGAITIGTMDGANVEMHKEVGADNIVIFGLTTDEVNEKINLLSLFWE